MRKFTYLAAAVLLFLGALAAGNAIRGGDTRDTAKCQTYLDGQLTAGHNYAYAQASLPRACQGFSPNELLIMLDAAGSKATAATWGKPGCVDDDVNTPC